MENNSKKTLTPEEKRAINQQKSQIKNQKKSISVQKKQQKKEKKEFKKDEKIQRQSAGKYYFYEFNNTNYSKTKVLEVKSFFWITLLIGAIFFLVPVFGIIVLPGFWRSILWVWPSLLIFYAFFNRFVESILSNIRNRNISLFFQRLIGIGYIILLFTYSFLLISILVNGVDVSGANEISSNAIGISSRPMIIIYLIISLVLLTLKIVGVCWYGTRKEGSYWIKNNDSKTKKTSSKKQAKTYSNNSSNQKVEENYEDIFENYY